MYLVYYYYFCASLPALTLGEKPAWTLAEFIERSQKALKSRDFRLLQILLADDFDVTCARASTATSGFIARLCRWETQLQNALARWRAARLNADITDKLRAHKGIDCALEKDVADICARANPLERELGLDRLRWRWAEDAARAAPFGMPGILGFALQLRLAWRWTEMDVDKGTTVATEQTDKIVAG